MLRAEKISYFFGLIFSGSAYNFADRKISELSVLCRGKNIYMVGEEGIEPSIRKEHDFESCAYTSSATRPSNKYSREFFEQNAFSLYNKATVLTTVSHYE